MPARYREALLAVLLLAGVAAAGWRFTGAGLRLGGDTGRTVLVAVSHSDCEALRISGFAQPVNAASALALVAVGLGVLVAVGRARRRPAARPAVPVYGASLGALILTVGVGSFGFHHSPTAAAGWLEAFGIAALGVWWLAYNATVLLRRDRRFFAALLAPALVAAGVAAWALPSAAVEGLQVAAIAAAAVSEIALLRRASGRDARRLAAALAVFAGGVAVWLLSRDGGPWCDPESLLQGHAAWHVVAAAGLALSAWYLWSEPGEAR